MSFKALVDSFCEEVELPITVDQVLNWIRDNTDFKHIKLRGIDRAGSKAYRGAYRRTDVNLGAPYSMDFDKIEIHVDILYGIDLPDDWKRLVIVKEVIHVFDVPPARVDTADKVAQLIPHLLSQQLAGTPFFYPGFNDKVGPFKAMAVLMPAPLRKPIKEAVDSGSRTIEEVAAFCNLPEVYVDMWLSHADAIEAIIFEDD